MTLTSLSKAPFPWAGTIEVRDDGSVWRLVADGRPIEPRRIDLSDRSKGYRNAVLPDPETGRWRTYKAHRLVWWWHNGDPGDAQIDHLNGDKTDNRIGNLDAVDQAENMRRSYANGRPRPWSLTGTPMWRGDRPRITETQRIEIRQQRASGALYREIAERFDISITSAQRIARGKETGE